MLEGLHMYKNMLYFSLGWWSEYYIFTWDGGRITVSVLGMGVGMLYFVPRVGVGIMYFYLGRGSAYCNFP